MEPFSEEMGMPLAQGTRIGPYEILAPLGFGGMGEVYHARDPRLQRAVAIKILSSSHGSVDGGLERFQREARAVARLSHPHICTLHDIGQQDGVPFLVMELLEGETLAEHLERGPVPLDRALTFAVQMAEALDAAHSKDVVHRDLKPSNVMLTPSGVKLLDFGLAKLRDGEYDPSGNLTKSLQLTDDGTVLGTLPYMAPEQVDGQSVDTRTDIFALGAVLYEMTTGRAPFQGTTRASLAAAILTHAPPPVSSVLPLATPNLDRIVTKCLAKHPDERWQSARDLAAALRWDRDERASGPKPTRPRSDRQRAMKLSLVAASAVVGAVAIWAFAGTARSTPVPATVAEYRPVTYRRGVVSSARFTPDGHNFVYSASWEAEPYRVFLGRTESPDARDLELEAARILSISRAGDMAVVFGPQNIERAFGTATLARIPLAGGARRDLLDRVVAADWIPGTDQLAVIRDPGGNRPWTIEFPAGTTVHQAPAAWSIRVSPDGSRIAFFEGPLLFDSAPEAMVTVIDKAGRKTTLSRNLAGLGLAWVPSGHEVWFTAARPGHHAPQLHAVSLSGVERTVHRAPDWLVLHDISAEGKVLLSRNSIRISASCQPPGESKERDLSWLVASFVSGLSPDGRTMIFFDALSGRTREGRPTLFRRSLDGAAAITLGEGARGVPSPDGKWALTGLNDNLILLPMGAGSALTLPKGDVVRPVAGAWLDANHIVFTGRFLDARPRGFVQEIPNGIPRAITAEGITLPLSGAVRNEQAVLGRSGEQWQLYPVKGGDPEPVPQLMAQDIPLQWSPDGRFVYIVKSPDAPRAPDLDVFRVELATGGRVLWKKLTPDDPVGVESYPRFLAITPDGRAYCYSYVRRLGDLYVVEGLQ
jgi:serine/threonine protein kinase